MIRVSILKDKQMIYGLEVKGHADYLPHGQDLVCAGVSSIITGGFNALNPNEIEEIKLEEGYAKVVLKKEAMESNLVLKVIVIQLQTIQESYSKFIIIK